MLLSLASFHALGQTKAARASDPVRLELSAEVAATTDNGQPAALRITLRNIGTVIANVPMPSIDCNGRNGSLQIHLDWHSKDPADSSGLGWGCASGVADGPSLLDRARSEWIRLQPGEFLTFTENLRPRTSAMKPGLVNYWIEYEPPSLSREERIELQANGYSVPTESLTTERQTFPID